VHKPNLLERHRAAVQALMGDRPLENVLAELAAQWPAATETEPWTERALCQETDPEAFFPDKGESTREAKRICHSCPVKDECLGYALTHGERFGIWGGMSRRERDALRRRTADVGASTDPRT
jgi:WhiB family redox-sensing transcriptional regulator